MKKGSNIVNEFKVKEGKEEKTYKVED